jgi:ubiquinone/menaquinone biosynthesis C-methylase UbiE
LEATRQVQTTSEYTVADQERMKAAQRYFQWQSKLAGQELGRRVLEVGCGMGNFTHQLGKRELIVGLDIDPNCLELWKQRFAGQSNYQGFVLNAEEEEFLSLRDYKIDSIACLNVLEHIDKHELVLHHMNAILPKGGRVVLIVPAFEALYGEIDAKLGHYRRYTPDSLRRVGEAAGFKVTQRYMNVVGFFGWWANAKIFHRKEQSEDQIAFFDSYIVPVMSRLEDWIHPPFGQSILAVLEKS